jgi:hypothetical protein
MLYPTSWLSPTSGMASSSGFFFVNLISCSIDFYSVVLTEEALLLTLVSSSIPGMA